MVSTIKNIYNDKTLYGEYLTNLTAKASNAFTTDKPRLYTKLEGKVENVWFVFEKSTKEALLNNNENATNEKTTETSKNFLPFKYLEIGFRKVAGALLTAGAYVTVAPLGFAIKAVHYSGMQIANRFKHNEKKDV